MEPVLKRETHGEVERLILNRPAQENMLDDSLLSALKQAFSEIAADSRVQCAIVTGSGESFCGGVEGGGYRVAEGGMKIPKKGLRGAVEQPREDGPGCPRRPGWGVGD